MCAVSTVAAFLADVLFTGVAVVPRDAGWVYRRAFPMFIRAIVATPTLTVDPPRFRGFSLHQFPTLIATEILPRSTCSG